MKDLDCHAMLAESSWETMQREPLRRRVPPSCAER